VAGVEKQVESAIQRARKIQQTTIAAALKKPVPSQNDLRRIWQPAKNRTFDGICS
jgi:hypothetical protein